MNDGGLVVMMMSLLILAGVAVLWMAMNNRRLIRELTHRERLAMIERGLIPSPELDPEGFEQRTGLAEPESRAAARSRSAGIIMIGFGLALMMFLSFAADAPNIGVGLGGAFALLGAAFIVNSKVMGGRRETYPPPPLARSPSRASEPRARPVETPDNSRNIVP